MAYSWISFGPDLEPLTSQSRHQAEIPLVRRDGLVVAGACGDVAAMLAQASESSQGWCALERVVGRQRQTVHVNARAVRFVMDETHVG